MNTTKVLETGRGAWGAAYELISGEADGVPYFEVTRTSPIDGRRTSRRFGAEADARAHFLAFTTPIVEVKA